MIAANIWAVFRTVCRVFVGHRIAIAIATGCGGTIEVTVRGVHGSGVAVLTRLSDGVTAVGDTTGGIERTAADRTGQPRGG